MGSNQSASIEEYEGKQKELERMFSPLASKLYGGQPGSGPAGAGCSSSYPSQNAGHSGPQVDEVD
jgi:hypothetical protein